MKTRIGLVVISLVLSALMGLALSRTHPTSPMRSAFPSRQAILIGLSMDTLKEARWQSDRDIFVERARSLGAEVLVQSANSDDTRQIRDVEALISRHVRVLVVIPHNGQAMAKAVNMANEAGIPVIAYDRLIRDCDLDLYMTFHNVSVGELQARYLLEHLPEPGKGRIIRIYGSKTDNNARLFRQGQNNILQPYIDRGDIIVLHEDWAQDWKPENAKKITNAAITRYGRDFDAILASNDGTAGGAIQALMEEGLAGKILVTGQDADLVACQRIAAGTQSMTVYKPLKALATHAADMAVRLATGKPVIARDSMYNGKVDVPAVFLKVTAVHKDNLETTVIQDGFHTREEIFGRDSNS